MFAHVRSLTSPAARAYTLLHINHAMDHTVAVTLGDRHRCAPCATATPVPILALIQSTSDAAQAMKAVPTAADCDTCRWMAPSVFHADGGQSAVYKQPEGDGERLQALQAVLSCPT
jgi:hypothetical protein